MSFNMIPNILVDSVVLPNKPLSNLEIIDAEYFCETIFLKKQN